MYAKVNQPVKIYRAVYYNEHKVAEKRAYRLEAGNFLEHVNAITMNDIMFRFERNIALNEGVKRNSIHLTLNFSPEDQLSDKKLVTIAREYMDRIGFGDQPYVAYRHVDAGHPHVHIVSTNIRGNGDRIEMNQICRRLLVPATKSIEANYGLIKKEKHRYIPTISKKPPPKIQYGKTSTKRGMTNVLEYVLDNYRFGSIEELNAILKSYNLKAERGRPSSNIFKHRGLVYHALRDDGQAIGAYIRAGALYFKPGLDYLEEKFLHYQTTPEEVTRVRVELELAILRNQDSSYHIIESLRMGSVQAVPYFDRENNLNGLNFVDLQHKLVINARTLYPGNDISSLSSHLGLDPRLNWKCSYLSKWQKSIETAPNQDKHLHRELDNSLER